MARVVKTTNAAKTHCDHGHEFTPENTYHRPDGRGRQCRACAREFSRVRYERDYRSLGAVHLPGLRKAGAGVGVVQGPPSVVPPDRA